MSLFDEYVFLASSFSTNSPMIIVVAEEIINDVSLSKKN